MQPIESSSHGRVNGSVSYLNPDAEYGFVLPIGWTYDDAKFFRKDVLPSLWLHLQVGSPVSFELVQKQNSSSRHRALRVAEANAEIPLGQEEFGRVKSFDKGIGFLTPENELISTLVGDVFFHRNSVETALAGILAGAEVTFRLAPSRSKPGKYEATAVRVSSKQAGAASSSSRHQQSQQAAAKPLVPPPSASSLFSDANTGGSKQQNASSSSSVTSPPPLPLPKGSVKDSWDDEDEPPAARPAAAVANNSAHSFLVYQDAIEEFVEIVSGWGADLVGAPLHHHVSPLPVVFSDIARYFSSFLPLLFEDVREQMHSVLERSRKSVTRNHILAAEWKSSSSSGSSDGKLLLRVSHIPGVHFLDCCLISSGEKNFKHLGIVQKTSRDAIEFRIRVTKIDPFHEIPAVGSTVEVTSLISLASAQRVYAALRSSVSPPHLAPMLIDPIRIKSLNQTRSWDVLPEKMEERISREFNPSQQEALRAFAELQEGILLVQGPPGTGKTSTILGLVGIALHQNSRVLICSPSNAAVDELVIRIGQRGVLGSAFSQAQHRPELSLLGNHEKIDTLHEPELNRALLQTRRELLTHVLQRLVDAGAQTWNSPTASNTVSQKFESELRTHFAERHLRRWSAELKLGADYETAALLMKAMIERLSTRTDDFDLEMLNASEVVCCTLSASGRSIMRRPELSGFDVVLVDEAAQGTEAETLVPLREHCKRLVLVGDPKQLPATVTSEVAQKAGYDRSMQARLMGVLEGRAEAKNVLLLLRTQYRMHPRIRQWPSAHFYHNLLDDAPTVQNQLAASPKYGHLVFVDCRAGLEERDPYSQSIYNRVEAGVVAEVLEELLVHSSTPLQAGQVGVITFYAAQTALLRTTLHSKYAGVHIATVDSFQGKEKEVIVLSFVRSNAASAVGFLRDMRRLNVALTRAKRSLILIGHAETLSTHPDLRSLVEFLRDADLIRTVK